MSFLMPKVSIPAPPQLEMPDDEQSSKFRG